MLYVIRSVVSITSASTLPDSYMCFAFYLRIHSPIPSDQNRKEGFGPLFHYVKLHTFA